MIWPAAVAVAPVTWILLVVALRAVAEEKVAAAVPACVRPP